MPVFVGVHIYIYTKTKVWEDDFRQEKVLVSVAKPSKLYTVYSQGSFPEGTSGVITAD